MRRSWEVSPGEGAPGPARRPPITCRRLALPAALLAVLLLGAPPVSAAQWSDPEGDVSLPSSDVICGSASVSNDTVHLVLRFAAPPFPDARTRNVVWCLDLDHDPSTGSDHSCAGRRGAEAVVDFENHYEERWRGWARDHANWMEEDQWSVALNYRTHSTVEAGLTLLHIFFPLEILPDDGIFDYWVGSTFGGSWGGNELAPDQPSTDLPFTSEFGATDLCGIDPEDLLELLIGDVSRLIDEGVLEPGVGNSLLVKLEGALDKLLYGNLLAARNKVLAFADEVEALLRDGMLPDPDGGVLLALARETAYAIEAVLGDSDGDGLPDVYDTVLTNPTHGAQIKCSSTGRVRPTIRWYRGNYDRFRVQIAWDPGFAKDRRVDSGRTLLRGRSWTPDRRTWRRACRQAYNGLYIRVIGIDRDAGRRSERRKTLSGVTYVSCGP